MACSGRHPLPARRFNGEAVRSRVRSEPPSMWSSAFYSGMNTGSWRLSGASEAGLGTVRTPANLLTFVFGLREKSRPDRSADRYRTALDNTTTRSERLRTYGRFEGRHWNVLNPCRLPVTLLVGSTTWRQEHPGRAIFMISFPLFLWDKDLCEKDVDVFHAKHVSSSNRNSYPFCCAKICGGRVASRRGGR